MNVVQKYTGRMGEGRAGLAGKTVLFSKVLSDSMSPERSEKLAMCTFEAE